LNLRFVLAANQTDAMNNVLLVCLLPAMVLAGPAWDGLRVTWDLNPFNTWAFNALPRDINHDDMKGFVMKDDQCAAGSVFRGRRYWYGNDPAVLTLYDVNGYIAGKQTSIPKSQYTPSAYNTGHPFISDGDYWTLTVYFVDPATICSTGRSAAEYANEGTGYGMWIQNGTNPDTDYVKLPDTELAASSTKWNKGKCVPTMGVHYWYATSTDMPCDQFFPFFPMFNGGKLNAVGILLNVNLESKRYEATHGFPGSFITPPPACMAVDPSYQHTSTMHLYMTDWPRTSCLC